MKKTFLTLPVIILAVVGFESLTPAKVVKKDGAEPGYTGSPGDLGDCTFCHGGFAVPVEGWLVSNIPAEGYEPGKTYTITATNTEWGATRFGFEVSPQDSQGNLLGTLVITDEVTTKLVGENKYVTYTANGVEGVDSMKWSFDWIAPPVGTGAVTFYGAFNSNFEGHKGGDQTYLTSLTVSENTGSAITERNRARDFTVYLNSAQSQLLLKIDVDNDCAVSGHIYDAKGRVVLRLGEQWANTGKSELSWNIAGRLSEGLYFVKIKSGTAIGHSELMIR